MDSEIKLLFMSDLHLGIRSDDPEIPEYARVSTFKRIAAIAREHDLFLIGGDLIDSDSVGSDIIDLLRTEFEGLKNAKTEIVYTPGTGELSSRSIMPPFLLDLNVSYLFSSTINPAPYVYTKENQKLYIYGVPATAGYDISKIRKMSDEGFHIGLFHVDFDGENGNSPVYRFQKNDIRTVGLDFYAFGFNHNFRMFKIMDRIIGVCPGSPESTSFSETGDRYVISIVIKENRLYQIKRLTVNSLKLYKSSIDCTDLVTMGPIKELLEKNQSKKSIQQLELTGSRDFVLGWQELESYKNEFFNLDIIDRSVPTLDALIEEFQNENSLRGEFYLMIKEQIERNGLPNDIDKADLAVSLNRITRDGFENLEDWLCNL
jgi:DNA repair exonuclease SbcCD nuclease subunit